jgi:hypothetical protein
MTPSHYLAGLAALALITTAAPAEAKVEISKTSSAALVKGSTFAWAPVPAVGVGLPDPAIANEITANRLQAITELTLTGRGYRQVADPDQADFLVSYTVGMMPTSDAEIAASGCDVPNCTLPADVNLATSIHTEGMLVLDLTERQSGRLVWRATSKKRVTGKDVSDKRLSALLREMTKSLPAQ